VPPERIALTASSSESYSLLFKILCDPGDEVLVPRPSYPLFEHLTRLEGVHVRPYDLEYHGAWAIDRASLVRQWSDRTKAVLIVSPNNPTGSFVKRDELAAIASECEVRGAAIIADEVFADFDLDDRAKESAGVPLECTNSLVFALGGLSKTVGLPQLKLGWIAVGGPDPSVAQVMERLELVCDMYLSVSTPVQLSLAGLLEGAAGVRRQIGERIRENYRFVARAIPDSSGCRLLNAEGGWYAVLQVPTYSPEEELVLKLIEHDDVLVHPGYFFDFPRESFLIVSLLTAPEVFAEGVSRLLRHFDC
jgi:aspartate/methionine/tyrosine aminotransferase